VLSLFIAVITETFETIKVGQEFTAALRNLLRLATPHKAGGRNS